MVIIYYENVVFVQKANYSHKNLADIQKTVCLKIGKLSKYLLKIDFCLFLETGKQSLKNREKAKSSHFFDVLTFLSNLSKVNNRKFQDFLIIF